MISKTPIPSWRSLFQLLRGSTHSEEELARLWCKNGDQTFLFSRSAWSLHAISCWWKSMVPDRLPSVWVPAFFCNQSLYPLRQAGVKLVFYPLDNHLQPDWDYCTQQAGLEKPDIFILVHYFGKPSDAKPAKKFCKFHQTILVEDATHVLVPEAEIGEMGHFTMYSPYKFLPMPDGAILVCHRFPDYFPDFDHGACRESFCDFVRKHYKGAPHSWKWLIKRISQKILPFCIQKYLIHKPDFEDNGTEGLLPFQPAISRMATKLLAGYILELRLIANLRSQNVKVLLALINNSSDFAHVDFPTSLSPNPYLVGVHCPNIDRAQKIYNSFRTRGSLVQSWPDLPPEVTAKPLLFSREIELRNTMLYFLIHQSITVEDFLHAFGLSRASASGLDGSWKWTDVNNKESWDEYIRTIENPTLFQSWAWGQAKIEEGWIIHNKLVMNDDLPVAIVQWFEKKFWWVSVFRINRGPLWFRSVDEETQFATLQFLRAHFSLLKGNVCFFAPELKADPHYWAALFKAGFWQHKRVGYSSIKIDLTRELPELRANLRSKWRNMLNVAEKADLACKISSSSSDYQWLMEKHRAFMAEKGFVGCPVSILERYKEDSSNAEMPLVFMAIHADASIAGILITRYGNHCMYTIGWIGPEGRKHKANNFLLWQAIVEMKRRGYHWFDLGGIDEYNTLEITQFKRGMGGVEYSLVGEYIAF